jgi:hypothetical protein
MPRGATPGREPRQGGSDRLRRRVLVCGGRATLGTAVPATCGNKDADRRISAAHGPFSTRSPVVGKSHISAIGSAGYKRSPQRRSPRCTSRIRPAMPGRHRARHAGSRSFTPGKPLCRLAVSRLHVAELSGLLGALGFSPAVELGALRAPKIGSPSRSVISNDTDAGQGRAPRYRPRLLM